MVERGRARACITPSCDYSTRHETRRCAKCRRILRQLAELRDPDDRL